MFVKEFMTSDLITITPDTAVPAALRLMGEKKIRRLPVVDSHGKLVGIVSDKDLLHASPSPATSLAIWEITDLMSKLKVEKVMTRDVVAVPEDTPLEEAALIMADKRIGSLLILRDKKLVGIITESDLFRILLDLLGGRRAGVRVTAAVANAKGTLAKITNAIYAADGDIVGLGVREIPDSDHLRWEVMLKVQDVAKDKLIELVQQEAEFIDARETSV
ncbi:MAG: CBS domain-containing protein [Ardenticatenaceae bacterium]|nr:CBS domain-containing protein [Ardenticatenaceae bacterium]